MLEPGWTAQEEMALLEAVMDCGFGNWSVLFLISIIIFCRSKFILNCLKDTFEMNVFEICAFFRQDVAYQMRTKTKEECEGHYMKNFINNPLFSSTLLSLRQMEEHLSRTADTAIPFKRK